MRYERAIEANLAGWARRGQWFYFSDSGGPGYCQLDFLHTLSDPHIVLEAKYTWTPEAHEQLHFLYLPIVQRALNCEARGVVVCKKLTAAIPSYYKVVGELFEAIKLARESENVVLHWLGRSVLHPRNPREAPYTHSIAERPTPITPTIAP